MIPGTLATMGEDTWARAINVNLMAAVYTTKHAAEHLKNNDWARILNVTGFSGTQLMPGALSTTIPNAGLIGFNKLMANELGSSNITVNNICPGMINTESWGLEVRQWLKSEILLQKNCAKGLLLRQCLEDGQNPVKLAI